MIREKLNTLLDFVSEGLEKKDKKEYIGTYGIGIIVNNIFRTTPNSYYKSYAVRIEEIEIVHYTP